MSLVAQGSHAFRRLVAEILRFQIRRLIRGKHPFIVAVTGSVGKTSTKLAIAQVLTAKYRVLVQRGNLNAEIGLEMMILNLPIPASLTNPWPWLKIFWQSEQLIRAKNYAYDAWVVELGVDHPGEMKKYLSFLRPDIGVVTAIAPAHLDNFKTIEAIQTEKLGLAHRAKQVLLNGDDARLAKQRDSFGAKPVYFYGLKHGEFKLAPQKLSQDGYTARLAIKQAEQEVKLGLVAEHSLYALAAGAGVGAMAGVGIGQIKQQLEQITPVEGRMNPLPGLRGSLILDDSYNSSPEAALAALRTLQELPGRGRRIAILGSMNELGDYTPKAHQEVGSACGDLDLLVTIGDVAETHLVPAARKAGLKEEQIKSFWSPFEAGKFMAGQVKAGDVVLAKGSQNGVFAEEAVALILADPTDRTKLVRQTEAWMKRKQRQFAFGGPLTLEHQKQQFAGQVIGDHKALRLCAPTCFYVLAKGYGYLDVDFFTFCKSIDWERTNDGDAWIRPRLSGWLRERYGLPIVSWQVALAGRSDIQAMVKAGYLRTKAEIKFFKRKAERLGVKQLVQKGYPVIVTVPAGFGGNNYLHAVILKSWDKGRVEVVDPDERNPRTYYDEAMVERVLAEGPTACSVVLPK